MSSAKTNVTTTTIDAGALVRIEGTIDEHIDTRALSPSGADVVVYDFDGVKRITSYGVLQWVKALRELRASYYGFMRCRPWVVRQFNMVPGFGKGGEVLSVYLPYFCEPCNAEFEKLLNLRADFAIAQNATPPEARCPTCNASAEFDDVPTGFFAFSSDYPAPSPPELAVRLIGAAVSSGAMGKQKLNSPAKPASSMRPRPPLSPPVSSSESAEGVDRLRKLQGDLNVTRDRLGKMIKERKSKT